MKNFGMIFNDTSNLTLKPFKELFVTKDLNNVQGILQLIIIVDYIEIK